MTANMHYTNLLADIKIEWEEYTSLRKEDAPKTPSINDTDNGCNVIKWVPIFQDYLSQAYDSRGSLIYVLWESIAIPSEVDDPLQTDETRNVINAYYDKIECLYDELLVILPHTGAIFKHNNATFYSLVDKSTHNTSVDSTVKSNQIYNLQLCGPPLPLANTMY